ncbi:hypothetical protein KKB18_12815 [bacterium]|nr:hypothetical protein [bacterium]
MMENKDEAFERNEVFPFKEYLKMNAIMWLFCLVVILLSYALTDAGEVIGFLFGFLGVGFTVVSIYDWLFDKFVKDI